MKLFTSAELKSLKQKSLDSERENASLVELATQKKRTEFLSLVDEFSSKKKTLEIEIESKKIELKQLRQAQEQEIALLEQRRKEAMAPITEEINKLEGLKKQNMLILSRVIAELTNVEKNLARQRNDFDNIVKENRAISTQAQKTAEKLKMRWEKAKNAEERADQMLRFYEVKKKEHLEREKLLSEEKDSLERTRVYLKGQMALLDQKIIEQKQEEKTIDSKRRALRTALKIANKKGIWL